jgi:hypothetical protein
MPNRAARGDDGFVQRAVGILLIGLTAFLTVLMWSGVSVANLLEMFGF